MPLYEYQCETCGPFRDWQPMSRSEESGACRSCGGPARRLVSAPFLPCVSRNVRVAHERNERSAEEPRVMRREEWRAAQGGLGHVHAGHHASGDHGRNMYRPSMLGHAH